MEVMILLLMMKMKNEPNQTFLSTIKVDEIEFILLYSAQQYAYEHFELKACL